LRAAISGADMRRTLVSRWADKLHSTTARRLQ
jgi:hypothetical protein